MIKKFAVLSHVVPPSASGQAVMLYRLLGDFSEAEYCIISRQVNQSHDLATKKLPAKYYFLETNLALPKNRNPIALLVFALRTISSISRQSKKLGRIINEQKIEALVACSGDFVDMISAYRATKKTGIKLVFYMFDDFANQWGKTLSPIFKIIDRRLISRADTVIVPNEFLEHDYQARRKNLKTVIVRNPVEPQHIGSPIFTPDARKKIVYTGAIYAAHYDAIRDICEVVSKLPDFELHLYTADDVSAFKNFGIYGQRVFFHEHISSEKIREIHRQSDFLLLPLAFHSPYPDVIRTSAPGKIGEYLMSGRPIIVHAPKDCFATWFFKKNNCGLVFDLAGAGKIIKRLKNIDFKSTEFKILAQAAQKTAKEFDLSRAREQFKKAIYE